MRSPKILCALLCSFCCGTSVATNDPMRPVPRPGSVRSAPAVESQPAPRRNWVLSSTLVGNARRVAVINDRLVGVGDEVLGARVIGIDARSARLRYAGRELVLQLGGPAAEKPSTAGMRGGAGQ